MMEIRERLIAAVGGLDRLASSFSARTFRNLNDRALMEVASGVEHAANGKAAIEAAAARAGRPDMAPALVAEFFDKLVPAWAAYQHAGARVLNWMVTGPARFPVARNAKRIATEDNRLTELLALSRGAGGWAEKRIKRAIAAELGAVGVAAAELVQAREKLAKLEKRQAMMVAVNKCVRKVAALEQAAGAAKLVELAAAAGFSIGEQLACQLLAPGMVGGKGFASFQLSNNGAEIRRMKDRVRVLEARAAEVEAAAAGDCEPAERVVAGVRVVEDLEAQRIRLFFDGRPAPSIIGALKAAAFKWAPSVGAWQRQLTANARAAAERVLGQVQAGAAA